MIQRTAQVGAVAIAILRARMNRSASWMSVLFERVSQLGGVYIKFLQFYAGTEHGERQLAEYKKRFAIYDDVTPETIDILQLLQQELGQNSSHIRTDSIAPLAAGSFAMVYSAQLTSGQSVVIKVLRPSVVRHLSFDLTIIQLTAKVVTLFRGAQVFNLAAIAREFAQRTRQEVNYIREVDMAKSLKEYYDKRPESVVIPHTYSELSTSRIIVQERINGLPLTAVVAHGEAGGDTREFVWRSTGSDVSHQLALFGTEFLTSILQSDIVMCDPHPGNIYLLPDNKVALVDFGLAMAAPKHRSSYLDMIRQYRKLYDGQEDLGELAMTMLAFYDRKLYDAIQVVSSEKGLFSKLGEYINTQLANESERLAYYRKNRQITELFMRGINSNNRLSIRLDPTDIMLQKALYSYLATVRMTIGTRDGRQQYWDVVRAALYRTEAQADIHGVRSDAPEAPILGDQAREIILNWLSQVAESDHRVFDRIADRSMV